LKDVYRIANIVKQNIVEFLVWSECLLELVLVRKSDYEIERWIPLLRDFGYLGADIDAFPDVWPDGSQKVASAASNR
jgi:hypothetical protein